jgi:hypothetical protein
MRIGAILFIIAMLVIGYGWIRHMLISLSPAGP